MDVDDSKQSSKKVQNIFFFFDSGSMHGNGGLQKSVPAFSWSAVVMKF